MFTKKLLKKLYGDGLSMKDIAYRQNVSMHTVEYWMNKFNIKRRSIGEAVYAKCNPDGPPFFNEVELK